MMKKQQFSSFLFLLTGIFTCTAFVFEDATSLIEDSTESGYDKQVTIHDGDVVFHWKQSFSSGVLDARLVHRVNSYWDLPNWVGFGIYDASGVSDGTTIDADLIQTMGSNAVLAALKPTFSFKKYSIDADQLWSISELPIQNLPYAGFSQRYNSGDGTYATVITFKKRLVETDPSELTIHTVGTNLFWWGWSEHDGLNIPTERGAFALDFSGQGGGEEIESTTPVPSMVPSLSPSEMPVTLSSDPEVLKDDWLKAHNDRRAALFARKQVSDVPLKWSSDIAASAQHYADMLIGINGCVIMHRYQGDKYGGENLYRQWSWPPAAQDKTPEDALWHWFEGEEDDDFPINGHRTQVAWRGTKYVGCGQASKVYNGQSCFISVCRYLAPGNCNVHDPADYETPMLKDSSPCGPQCPAQGCF